MYKYNCGGGGGIIHIGSDLINSESIMTSVQGQINSLDFFLLLSFSYSVIV